MNTTHSILYRVTVLAALVALTGSLACTAKRSPGTRLDDATITAKVKTRIAADPHVNPFEIDVDTVNGVVRLSGTVESAADRAEIVELAENTSGVVRVQNEIRLGDPTAQTVLADSVIASKVKAKLIADPDVNPFRIDVDVIEGVVTLTGEVDDQGTADEAGRLAASTSGVERVDNRIKVSEQDS